MTVPKPLTNIPTAEGGFVTPLSGPTHLTFPKKGGYHMTDNLSGDAKVYYDLGPSGDITGIRFKRGKEEIEFK